MKRQVMELPAGSQSSTDLFSSLTETFTSSVNGSLPGLRPTEVAAVIFSGMCGSVSDGNREDLSCLSLTVLRRVTGGVVSQKLPAEVELGWVEVLRVLFQDGDLMPQLVQLFGAEDQLLSHLAARTASVCVFHLLRQTGTLSPVWQKNCVQTFHSSAPGPELDSYLFSLTELLKKLLRGTDSGILRTVMAAFAGSLRVLCSKLLPEDGGQTLSSSLRGTTLCLLMDLLEVLTAATAVCGAGLCGSGLCGSGLCGAGLCGSGLCGAGLCGSGLCGAGLCGSGLGIISTHSLALLRTISCSSQYFVSRRVLLLLKRTLFQKLGEDWSLPPRPTQAHLSSGVRVVARCVMVAVAENWLQTIPVERDPFFGGTESIGGREGQTLNGVVLRAVSLILLKSVQVQIQRTGPAEGVDRTRTFWTGLQSLWDFLRWSHGSLRELPHRCCWVSLLFGEQDDDLMEAASTCLSVFLTFRQSSELDNGAALEAACSSGCNPHCHFILLLQSFSFDHSVLLDFLISMETCFLEYFVCYLKFLREDWQGFSAACRGVAPSAGPSPGSRRGVAPSAGPSPGSRRGVAPSAGPSPGSRRGVAPSAGPSPGSRRGVAPSAGPSPGSRRGVAPSAGPSPGSRRGVAPSAGPSPGSRRGVAPSAGPSPGSRRGVAPSAGPSPGSRRGVAPSAGPSPGSRRGVAPSAGPSPGSRRGVAPSAGPSPGSRRGVAPSAGPSPGSRPGVAPSAGPSPGSRPGIGLGWSDAEGRSSLGSGLRLVEYDSSESDPEDLEESELLEETRCNVLDWNQNQSSSGSVNKPAGPSLSGSASDVRGAAPVSLIRPSFALQLGPESCETLDRAVLCLTELRDVVRRLQKKNLFPYNPASLLKLLSQLEPS